MFTLLKYSAYVMFKLSILIISLIFKIDKIKSDFKSELHLFKYKWSYILSDFNIKNIRMRLKLYKPVDDFKTHMKNDQKRREQDRKVFDDLMSRAFKDNL